MLTGAILCNKNVLISNLKSVWLETFKNDELLMIYVFILFIFFLFGSFAGFIDGSLDFGFTGHAEHWPSQPDLACSSWTWPQKPASCRSHNTIGFPKQCFHWGVLTAFQETYGVNRGWLRGAWVREVFVKTILGHTDLRRPSRMEWGWRAQIHTKPHGLC